MIEFIIGFFVGAAVGITIVTLIGWAYGLGKSVGKRQRQEGT